MTLQSIATAIALFVAFAQAVKVNPLPKPQSITWSKGNAIQLSDNFKIVSDVSDSIITGAITRTHSHILKGWEPQTWEVPLPEYPPYPGPKGPDGPIAGRPGDSSDVPDPPSKRAISKTLDQITVTVDDVKIDLVHGVDESYTIDITHSDASISAKTRWGAIRALATLEQIVISDPHGNGFIVEAPVSISDKPNYPHRGILLDTGRNFYPVKDILRTIDAMEFSKINVFHWHIEDSQSWPIQIKCYPEMTKDAYSKREIYTHSDIRKIIKYARNRGVRVIPEIDMPGHAAAGWKQIDPKIVTCDKSWWDNDGWKFHSSVEPTPGQLDIIYPKTYNVIANVYNEIAKLFVDGFFHGGFDELHTYCFNYSQPISDWFNANKSRTYADLSQHYFDKTYPVFKSKKDRIIYWEDVLLGGGTVNKKGITGAHHVPKDVILQSWNNGVGNVQDLTKAGYDVIVASSDFWYLDCGHGGWVTNDNRYDQDSYSNTTIGNFNYQGNGGSWCDPYKTWQRVYSYDFTANLTRAQKKHVLGGEVSLWSEQADGTVIDSRLWPRAAAFAESLWSGNRDSKGRKRYSEAATRVLEFRERLVARGVQAAPLVPKWCLKHPHRCDLNLHFRNGYNVGEDQGK